MGINVLHHVTVKTDDLEATRDFYRDVLGLEEGFRPDLDSRVIGSIAATCRWCIWCRGRTRSAADRRATPGRSTIFAFLASDFDGIKAKLEKYRIKYRENHIAKPPIDQLFFPDNNNVMVELNFPRS